MTNANVEIATRQLGAVRDSLFAQSTEIGACLNYVQDVTNAAFNRIFQKYDNVTVWLQFIPDPVIKAPKKHVGRDTMSIFASLALALASQGIVAQDPDLVTGADWTEVAFSELDAGNDQTAIRKLEAIRAESGDEPALLVNLASAYARVGRTEEARVAYYDVLALDDMELELADGRWISSHTIAAVSLKRLASVSVARR